MASAWVGGLMQALTGETLVSQAQLSRVLFPLGPLTKSTVRRLAAAAGLATQGRKDSQGICFLGKVRRPARRCAIMLTKAHFVASAGARSAGLFVWAQHVTDSIQKHVTRTDRRSATTAI